MDGGPASGFSNKEFTGEPNRGCFFGMMGSKAQFELVHSE